MADNAHPVGTVAQRFDRVGEQATGRDTQCMHQSYSVTECHMQVEYGDMTPFPLGSSVSYHML